MVFSSVIFTFCFLPIVLGLYYLIRNDRVRNLVLLFASLFFYAYGEPGFVFVMLGSILVNYVLALGIENVGGAPVFSQGKRVRGAAAKWLLALDVAVNLGILFIFKYLDFSLSLVNDVTGLSLPLRHIALPIGISFFTFQAMSYVIDVYRGDAPVQKNLFHLALYISFFPQLIAGPIVRYKDVAAQIEGHRTMDAEKFGYGARRFMTGFAKKILVANNMALVAEQTFAVVDFGGESHTILFYWLGALAYSLQIYFDFSGYSDMAIGLGQMFGFHFLENFNDPYMATSVTDFWRRWHMSLSGWFRDYVYIPLGGSRVKVGRHLFNLFMVWALTGIWHGANYTFVMWGLVYWICLVVEKYVILPEKRGALFGGVYRIVTLLIVMFAWVLFRAESLGQGLHYIAAMLGYNSHVIGFGNPENVRIWREFGAFYVLGLVLCLPIRSIVHELAATGVQTQEATAQRKLVVTVISAVVLSFGFLWSLSFLILGAHNPFIYFNF